MEHPKQKSLQEPPKITGYREFMEGSDRIRITQFSDGTTERTIVRRPNGHAFLAQFGAYCSARARSGDVDL